MRQLKGILIVIVAATCLFMMMSTHSQKETLPVYTSSDKIEEETATTQETKPIETTPYTTDSFTVNIPSEWEQVNNKGQILFSHRDSGSTIEFLEEDYDPMINQKTKESLSSEISEQGFSFVSFVKENSSCYEITYQKIGETTYDYIEDVHWTRGKIVHLKCCFNDKNYENILPYYQKILKSFSWTKKENQSLIDPDYGVVYMPQLKIQFGVPISWTLAQTDSTLSATDEKNGSVMNVYSMPCTENFKTLTGTDIANQLNDNFSSFAMKQYTNTDNTAHAVCAYMNGNTEITREAYIFLDGKNAYFLVFDYTALDENIPKTCISYFSSF